MACSNVSPEEQGSSVPSEEDLTIVTTFYPMYEFTKQIVGEEAEVSMLVHAGSDIHSYEPSAQDMASIHEADLFVYANPEMEVWAEDVLNSLEDSDVVPVMADARSELIDNQEQSVIEDGDDHAHEGHDHSHEDGQHNHEHEGYEDERGQGGHHHIIDPHTWLDPVLAQKQVEVIMEAVIEKDPENETFYKENGEKFLDELKDLHKLYIKELTGVENNQFLVEHAAFGYIAERYNLIQYSLAGLSNQTEADPQVMIEAVYFIEEENLPVLYYNSQSNTQLAETIAEEAGIETDMLHALESLTDEELEAGLDYTSVMKDNLRALKKSIR